MKSNRVSRENIVVCLLILSGLFVGGSVTELVYAQGFAARIGPPHFELRGQPGDRLRELINIQNDATKPSKYVIRSADWDLNPAGGVEIRPEAAGLAPESCRPWVRLERPRLTVGSGNLKRYRFEVEIPGNATASECRFAILIGPAPESLEAMDISGLSVPIAGQIAVIVYVTIGSAKAELQYLGGRIIERNGKPTPVVRFRNTGNAHGRPFGSVSANNGGENIELVAIPYPILPGREFDISLQPHVSDPVNPPSFTPVAPMSIKGRIEWDGGTIQITDTLTDSN